MDIVLILLILHSMFYMYISVYQYVYPKLRILHHMLLGLSEGSHGILKATYSTSPCIFLSLQTLSSSLVRVQYLVLGREL